MIQIYTSLILPAVAYTCEWNGAMTSDENCTRFETAAAGFESRISVERLTLWPVCLPSHSHVRHVTCLKSDVNKYTRCRRRRRAAEPSGAATRVSTPEPVAPGLLELVWSQLGHGDHVWQTLSVTLPPRVLEGTSHNYHKAHKIL